VGQAPIFFGAGEGVAGEGAFQRKVVLAGVVLENVVAAGDG
jgi:hypothetical protein